MNALQTRLYFYEWARVRDHYVGRGLAPAAADAKRHEIHAKALGKAKSSKLFTNADLDQVIAAFRAVSDGGNLDAQLRQIDQPLARRAALTERVLAAGRKFIIGNDAQHVTWKTLSYVSGIVKKLGARSDWPIADEALLGKVVGIMERRARQVAAVGEKGAAHGGAVVKEVAGENPF